MGTTKPASRLAQRFQFRYRYHLHVPGLVYLLLVVLVGLAAANRPNNLLVWVFAAMLTGVLLSGVVSGFMLMRLHVQRSVPRTARAGEALAVRYQLVNSSRVWPIFALFVREMSAGVRIARAFVQHVGPGEQLVAETVLVPQRRGLLQLDRFRAETVFPFGLVLKSVRFEQPADVLVLPRTHILKSGALANLTAGGLSGSATSRRAGPGADFLSVREYRPGDSLRHVSWRRSATTGDLAVVERSVDVPPRIHVVLDLRRATSALRLAGDARAAEEQAIELTASLLAQADHEAYEMRLTVLGFDSPSMPLRRGHWHLHKMLAQLASLDLDMPRNTQDLLRADRERMATLVVHVDRADLAVGGENAVHLTASQLPSLVAVHARPGSMEAQP